MDFPIFKMRPDEVAVIWGILLRYPNELDKKYAFRFGPFRPSVRVKGVVEKLIGPSPLADGVAA